MRAVVQRVAEASVMVGGETVGAIEAGLCVLVGVTHTDTGGTARKLADRLAKLRIFAYDEARMNRSVLDVGGSVLVVSQFTLYADTSKGNRPGFSEAALAGDAEPLVDLVAAELADRGIGVATGRFGAEMEVRLVNDGPVTLILEVGAS